MLSQVCGKKKRDSRNTGQQLKKKKQERYSGVNRLPDTHYSGKGSQREMEICKQQRKIVSRAYRLWDTRY